ncbi:MAG: ATP-binding cassette domain-containing protein [Chloroflexota bacterium]
MSKREAHRLEDVETFGLTYRFPESGRGIVDVSLRVERGTFTVVTGRVVSGKKTLLRVLLGLLPRDSGEVHWNGAVVAEPGAFFVPPRCAYVPQVPRLFSDTVRENILLGLPDAEVNLQRAVRLAVLDDDLSVLGRNLETVVGQRGTRLSGGQVQRVAAARALAADPELLVLDDLSSALDVATERELWERLASERGEMTCLAVSHRRPALQRAPDPSLTGPAGNNTSTRASPLAICS